MITTKTITDGKGREHTVDIHNIYGVKLVFLTLDIDADDITTSQLLDLKDTTSHLMTINRDDCNKLILEFDFKETDTDASINATMTRLIETFVGGW